MSVQEEIDKVIIAVRGYSLDDIQVGPRKGLSEPECVSSHNVSRGNMLIQNRI